jgi:hypothetical protein
MEKVTNEEFMIIMDIVERADEMELMAFDRLSLSMDLAFTHEELDLRLKDLLEADDFNFAHDIVGIQNNLNRQTKQMENYFLPRFTKY